MLLPSSGTVTVACSTGRFLAVTLKDAVFRGMLDDGGASADSVTINGSIGALIP